jgi:hypothetical protein
MSKKMVIKRTKFEKVQTLGELEVIEELFAYHQWVSDDLIFESKTLELPWLDNAPYISCIPVGIYDVKKRWSPRFGFHFHILDVEGRTWILMHAGNFFKNTKGCTLVGDGYKKINDDKWYDLTNSKRTLRELYRIMPERFELEIRNANSN